MQSTSGFIATAGQGIALALAGLLAGSLFGIRFGYDVTAYSPATFVEVQQHAIAGLNDLLPLMGLAEIVLLAVLAWSARRRPEFWLYLVAVVGMIVAGLVTRFGNQPINAMMVDWTASALPANWDSLRHDWWNWHAVRLVATAVAFATLVAATLRRRS